jgi:hypothetical protein
VSTGIGFLAKNWQTEITLHAGALSCRKIQQRLNKHSHFFGNLTHNFVKT